jgi:hypothetical protein
MDKALRKSEWNANFVRLLLSTGGNFLKGPVDRD